MTIASWITLSRLLGIPFLFYGLHNPTDASRWGCLAIFGVVSLTDWLDGFVARRFNQVSEMGKFLDPLADKLLVLAPLLALVELQRVPAWGVFLILARELTIAGWRVTPPLQGQIDAPIPGANLWGKAKTVVQIGAIALLIAPLPPVWQPLVQLAFWLAVGLTLVSGLIYLVDRAPNQPKPTPQA